MSVASTQQELQRAQERTQHGPGRVNLTPDAGHLVLDAVEAPLDAVESSVDSAELSVGLGAQLVDPLVEARPQLVDPLIGGEHALFQSADTAVQVDQGVQQHAGVVASLGHDALSLAHARNLSPATTPRNSENECTDRGVAPPTPPLQQALAAYLRELAERIDAQSPPLPSWLLRRIANTLSQEAHVVARFDAHHQPTGSLHIVGGQKGQSK